MRLLSFWPTLEPGRRFLYLFLGIFLLVALGAGIYGYFFGADVVFPLIKQADLYPAAAQLFPSSPLLTPLHVNANAYLVSEQYGIGDMQLPIWGTWLHFAGITFSLALFWALISSFRRMPYYIGVGLGMLWLSTLNLDLLGIFSETSRYTLIIALATLGLTSYLFHAFWQQASLLVRFAIFSALVLLLVAALFFFSPLPASLTAFHVVQYGTVASLAASVLLMILVAYENLHGLLWLNTQAKSPQRRFGLIQFMAISILYLGNLLLLFLNQTGIFRVDFAGIDALLVFLVSVAIGFWGLHQRQAQYGRVLRFETEALPLYLILALLTFLNLGYALLMANDPMVQAYRSAIIVTHLAFGIAFLVYLLVNFGHLIKQKLRVYRVVYEPKRLNYFVVYLMGGVLLVVLLFRSQFMAYQYSQAGYLNYLGDLYRQTEESPLLAEQFYLEGRVTVRGNQRSSLSLADMYHQANMRTLEMQQLQELLLRKPSPEVYVRLANLYTSSADLFDHIRVLQEGIRSYPEYAPLLNNMGLLYGTTSFTDSAAFYLDAALTHTNEPEVVQANQLAFLTRHQFHKQAQEFTQKYQGDYGPLQTNRLAIALVNNSKPSVESQGQVLQDSVLSTQQFAHFYIRQLSQATPKDTAVLAQIEKLLRQEENEPFQQDLFILKAFLQQRLGKPARAKATLEHLAATNPRTAGYFYDILGQWMLQVQLYNLAAQYFEHAAELGFRDAALHAAVAQALTGETNRAAQVALQAANVAVQPQQQKAATQLAMVTQLTPDQAAGAPDSLKVQFLQIFAPTLPMTELEQVAQEITTAALAPTAALPLIERYIAEDEFQKAAQQLQAHFPASFPENRLKSKANVLTAELLWKTEQYQALLQRLPSLFFASQDAGARLYYQALLAQRNNKTKEATNYFNALVQKAPWSEMGHLAAANFFVNEKKPLRAYDLLLEGIGYNPLSVALRKAYIRIAISQGFEDYALTALEQLEPLVSPQEYLAFRQEIDTLLQETRNRQQEWQ